MSSQVSYKLKSVSGNPSTLRSPNTHANISATIVPNIRCPHCMHMGAFTQIIQHDLHISHIERKGPSQTQVGTSVIGLRICPNSLCKGVVCFVHDPKGDIVLPNEVLDFDVTDIPAAIANSLEEAIKCHSGQCYKASALMVRRVLEELCDERGAKGSNLKDRLNALSTTMVLPSELLKAADHLRLLGNDAAHIEAKTYENVGEPEVRAAIDLTKELLKAAYQYKGLLGRLTALQKP